MVPPVLNSLPVCVDVGSSAPDVVLVCFYLIQCICLWWRPCHGGLSARTRPHTLDAHPSTRGSTSLPSAWCAPAGLSRRSSHSARVCAHRLSGILGTAALWSRGPMATRTLRTTSTGRGFGRGLEGQTGSLCGSRRNGGCPTRRTPSGRTSGRWPSSRQIWPRGGCSTSIKPASSGRESRRRRRWQKRTCVCAHTHRVRGARSTRA